MRRKQGVSKAHGLHRQSEIVGGLLLRWPKLQIIGTVLKSHVFKEGRSIKLLVWLCCLCI